MIFLVITPWKKNVAAHSSFIFRKKFQKKCSGRTDWCSNASNWCKIKKHVYKCPDQRRNRLWQKVHLLRRRTMQKRCCIMWPKKNGVVVIRNSFGQAVDVDQLQAVHFGNVDQWLEVRWFLKKDRRSLVFRIKYNIWEYNRNENFSSRQYNGIFSKAV